MPDLEAKRLLQTASPTSDCCVTVQSGLQPFRDGEIGITAGSEPAVRGSNPCPEAMQQQIRRQRRKAKQQLEDLAYNVPDSNNHADEVLQKIDEIIGE